MFKKIFILLVCVGCGLVSNASAQDKKQLHSDVTPAAISESCLETEQATIKIAPPKDRRPFTILYAKKDFHVIATTNGQRFLFAHYHSDPYNPGWSILEIEGKITEVVERGQETTITYRRSKKGCENEKKPVLAELSEILRKDYGKTPVIWPD